MLKIKICGITNLADALLAVELGADLLGFNFYDQSPRWVSAAEARQIIDRLEGRTIAVGVFVNADISRVLRTADEAGLNAIQLHGDETAEYYRELRARSRLRVIKAFRVGAEVIPQNIDEYTAGMILVDAFSSGLYGGSGHVANRGAVQKIVSRHNRVLLAGGLTPENVGGMITDLRPYGVDVASGVEWTKRKKDPQKLTDFIENARKADELRAE